MSYNYRCTDRKNCGTRKTLKRLIDQYIRRPKCPSCKRDTLAHDPAVKRDGKRFKCNCDGYPYPHHVNTEPWCIHAPIGPTDEDYRERYANTN